MRARSLACLMRGEDELFLYLSCFLRLPLSDRSRLRAVWSALPTPWATKRDTPCVRWRCAKSASGPEREKTCG